MQRDGIDLVQGKRENGRRYTTWIEERAVANMRHVLMFFWEDSQMCLAVATSVLRWTQEYKYKQVTAAVTATAVIPGTCQVFGTKIPRVLQQGLGSFTAQTDFIALVLKVGLQRHNMYSNTCLLYTSPSPRD